MKALSLLVWKLWPKLKFFRSRSNFKVKTYGTMWKVSSQGIHMQYESPITSGFKVMAKVKVFEK